MGIGSILGSIGNIPNKIGGLLGGSQDAYQPTAEERQRGQQMGQLEDTRKQLSGNAQQYRQNLGATQNKQFEQSTDPARTQLARRMSDIDSSANSRGLLYSGLKQGAQADANAGYASGLAQNRTQINADTNNRADQMDQAAISAGLDQQQLQQSIYDDQYQRDLKARDARMGVLNKLGGAVGGLVGSGAGR